MSKDKNLYKKENDKRIKKAKKKHQRAVQMQQDKDAGSMYARDIEEDKAVIALNDLVACGYVYEEQMAAYVKDLNSIFYNTPPRDIEFDGRTFSFVDIDLDAPEEEIIEPEEVDEDYSEVYKNLSKSELKHYVKLADERISFTYSNKFLMNEQENGNITSFMKKAYRDIIPQILKEEDLERAREEEVPVKEVDTDLIEYLKAENKALKKELRKTKEKLTRSKRKVNKLKRREEEYESEYDHEYDEPEYDYDSTGINDQIIDDNGVDDYKGEHESAFEAFFAGEDVPPAYIWASDKKRKRKRKEMKLELVEQEPIEEKPFEFYTSLTDDTSDPNTIEYEFIELEQYNENRY